MALVESPYLLEAPEIGSIFVVASGEKYVEIPIAGPSSAALSLRSPPGRKDGVKVSAGRGNFPEDAIPCKANTVAVRTPGDVRNGAVACDQFLIVCPVNFHRMETLVPVRIRNGSCVRRPGRRGGAPPLQDEPRQASGGSGSENTRGGRKEKTCSIRGHIRGNGGIRSGGYCGDFPSGDVGPPHWPQRIDIEKETASVRAREASNVAIVGNLGVSRDTKRQRGL